MVTNLRNSTWATIYATLSTFNGQTDPNADGIITYYFDDGTTSTAVSKYTAGDSIYAIIDTMRDIAFDSHHNAFYYSSGSPLNKKLKGIGFNVETYPLYADSNFISWITENAEKKRFDFRRMCRGKIIDNSKYHFEEVLPVDTDEPTTYVARWDCSRTINDSVRAYLIGDAYTGYELHFYGYGEIASYTRSSATPYSNAPWASYMTQIKKVQFHDGITAIGFATFYRPLSNALSNVNITISKTVRIIRQNAFYGILQSAITIPDGVRVICPAALSAANTDTTLTVPNTVQEIDYATPTLNNSEYGWVQAKTTSGGYLVVGDGCLLWGNPTGTVWTIPDGVKSVNCTNWNNRANVTKVNLPSTTEIIALGAFSGYSRLQSIKLPQGTRQIKGQAFANCTTLTKIWIPRSVTNIVTNGGNGGNAEGTYYPFTGCSNLTIYCEINSNEVPEGWHSVWNNIDASNKASVVWGYPEPTDW